MRTLSFDGRMGASGDMLLGALLDAGADPAVLGPVEDALDVRYDVRDVTRNGISATSVAVVRPDGGDRDQEHSDEAGHDHGHDQSGDREHAGDQEHEHGYSHDDHSHDHDHDHSHDH
ncbi:MAG: nickel insertion protein, partial [Haloarculaceae archaeon]